jgi:site-specific recombinase XerD
MVRCGRNTDEYPARRRTREGGHVRQLRRQASGGRREATPASLPRQTTRMYVRHLEGRGYAPAMASRRFAAVATFYGYAVVVGALSASPADAVMGRGRFGAA